MLEKDRTIKNNSALCFFISRIISQNSSESNLLLYLSITYTVRFLWSYVRWKLNFVNFRTAFTLKGIWDHGLWDVILKGKQSVRRSLDGKAISLEAWTSPEGSKRLRLPDFKTIGTWSWEGCQPYAFTPQEIPWYSCLLEAECGG